MSSMAEQLARKWRAVGVVREVDSFMVLSKPPTAGKIKVTSDDMTANADILSAIIEVLLPHLLLLALGNSKRHRFFRVTESVSSKVRKDSAGPNNSHCGRGGVLLTRNEGNDVQCKAGRRCVPSRRLHLLQGTGLSSRGVRKPMNQ